MKKQDRVVRSHVGAAETRVGGPTSVSQRLTVVVPTRNEAANIAVLLRELEHAVSGIDTCVLFVDDSDDDTPDVVRAAAERHSALNVDLVHRPPERRRGGLATAVVEGLRRARSPWVCVMDGDLQHPPALVPALLAAAERENASLVVASRYCAGGDNGGLSSRTRVFVSRATSITSKLLFPRALNGISDPMSGFFLVSRDAVDVDALEPEGFKILLEIAARTSRLRVVEVPCAFAPRHAGETKANMREGLRFARHVARLRLKTAPGRVRHPKHLYDIHGLVSVESGGLLPELEQFRVTQLPPADIRVEIGKLSATPPTNGGATGRDPFTFATRYAELGNVGFGADIEVNGKVDVRTTRLVGKSPHVLYTNVVEPIMRWRMVERGYALIHGACVVEGDKAYLITARTDTGKTTTMLKLLDRWPYKFVSDDLTLVSPNGEVLPYPKPLTISSHTLHAVKRSQLTRRERLTLPVQSRLHSRSGRRFAFILTKLHVPAASLNALVQFLIPPPKYPVGRLVPGVSVAKSAKLAGMIVIQRGPNDLEWLSGGDALDVLLANTEDAYGFPPYHAIESFMLGASSVNLRTTERQIVAGALENVPAVLLTRDERDWASHIPSLIDVFSSRDRIREQSERQRGSDVARG